MEGERLSQALWLRALLRKFPTFCLRAATEGLFVCIPQTASLGTPRVSERDLSHHIVRSTGGLRGEFMTLSGRLVVISGSDIVTGEGFPEYVSARIIGSDRVRYVPPASAAAALPPGGGDLFLSIYFITRPLEGGVEAPSSVDDLDHASVLQTVAMLRALPETEPVFNSLRDMVTLTRMDLQQLPPGVEVPPSVSELLLSQCESAAEALVSSSFYAGGGVAAGRGTPPLPSSASPFAPSSALALARAPRRHLLQVLESWCMEQLHDELLPRLAAAPGVRNDCEALRAVFRGLAGSTPEDFKVKASFRCSLAPAVAALGLLHTAATPLEKLHCLRGASLTLQRCVERHLESVGANLADVEFATDDMLDGLLWVLVAGASEQATYELPAHLAYIQRFHFAAETELVMSRLGYYLANFEQALGYFTLNAAELLRDREALLRERKEELAAEVTAAAAGDYALIAADAAAAKDAKLAAAKGAEMRPKEGVDGGKGASAVR